MKVCSIKKPESPSISLTLPIVRELCALSMIEAFVQKTEKMFLEIVHKGICWYHSLGRCPPIANLAGTDLPNKTNRTTSLDSHYIAEQYHMHLDDTYDFQHFLQDFSSSTHASI